MSNLRRMLSRAMRTSPWDDGKKDREWGMTKRRQRRIEQRETGQLVTEAAEPEPGAWPPAWFGAARSDRTDTAARPEEILRDRDCRHGCNGSPCGGETCTSVCHG